MKSSLIIVGAIAIASSAIIYNVVTSDSDNLVSNQLNKLITSEEKKLEDIQKEAEVLAPVGLSRSLYTASNLETGYIGINAETNIDNPHDNTFHIILDGEIESGRQAWLEYDLYGVEDYTSVSRAINDQVAIGGAFVKLSQDWSVQREKIDASQLHKGDNIVRFSIPGNSDFNYIVKNVRIRFDEGLDASRRIVLNQPMSKSYYNRYGYISGFVSGNGSEHAKIYANGKPVRSNQSVFEGIVDQIADHGSDWKAVITAVFEDGQTISDTARFCNPATCDFTNEISTDLAFNETKVNAQMPVHMNIPGFELNGEPGSVNNNVTLSVTGLRAQDMALPRLAMVNVTGGSDGYRCLPHGNNFAKEIEVRVKYDTARIPKGYGPKDIRTFYYSEEQGDWIQLPYDTFDLASCEIVSHTTHFTDFINAILKTPESPQTQAFTPTSMKDMKFADPVAHINMMSPPQANNSGTANMSFPIKVPTGRQGLQPQLALNYSSENGNGFLGVGWSMQIPSISVETRWGVPTYNELIETEEYLVNGQQLVQLEIVQGDTVRDTMIHMAANARPRGTGDVIYSYRIEGAFDRIIRHGSNPYSYWWEVIDKQGTHYYYGKYSSDAGVNSNCVLSQPNTGNIAYWALCEVKDIYGNYVKYEYSKGFYAGTPGNGGQQLLIHRIFYTGMDNGQIVEAGKYRVDFEYQGGRSDYEISGKFGFLEVTDSLLTDIKMYFDNTFINRYEIWYKQGAYDKNLICGVLETTETGPIGGDISCGNLATANQTGFKGYQFEYYEEEGFSFNTNADMLTNIVEIQEALLNGAFTVPDNQSIGRSKSLDFGFGASLCLGVDLNILTKANSAGGNTGYSKGYQKEKIQVMDLNGDGLPDKIVRHGNSFDFFKGEINNSKLTFDPTVYTITSLPNLGVNTSETSSKGAEIQIKYGVSGSASKTKSTTTQRTDYYFADINADGYVDYVDDGLVYYNQPDSNDIPVFIAENGNTVQYFADDPCYYTIQDGTIDSTFNEYLESDSNSYRRDPVKMWIAPDEGHVKIISEVKRINLSPGHNSLVYYSIQLNNTVIVCDTISETDTTSHDTIVCPIVVNKGDKLYFRMHSDDMRGLDDIYWDPIIYSETLNCQLYDSYHDADGKRRYFFQYSQDAVIHDEQYFVAPFSGNVVVRGNINSPAQSDNLLFRIKHNNNNLYTTTYLNNQAFNHSFSYNVSVNAGDSIMFDLVSNTNVDWSAIDFSGNIKYYYSTVIDIDTNNTYKSYDYYPSLDMSIFPNLRLRNYPTVLNSGTHVIYPKVILSSGSQVNGTITISAKKNHQLLAKKQVSIVNGVVQGTPFYNSLSFSLSSTDTVYLDFHTSDLGLIAAITDIYPYDRNGRLAGGFFTVYPDTMKKFGNLYRGWGQFSYYDSSATGCTAIDQSKLNLQFTTIDSSYLAAFPLSGLDTSMTFEQMESIFNAYGLPDLYSVTFMPMMADREHDRWIDGFKSAYADYENMGSASGMEYIENNLIDTTLLDPEDDFFMSDFNAPIVMTNQFGASRAISKISKQISKSYSFSFGVSAFDLSTTKTNTESQGKIDFMDMNGDRFPDVVGLDKIQYSTPHGGISSKKLYFSDIYPSLGNGTSISASFGVQPAGFKNDNTKQSPKSKFGNFSGAGVGVSGGNSKLDFIYSDINGDGLNDRINKANNSVQLSTGYHFNTQETWNLSDISKTMSTSTSVNAGFNSDNYSWSAGIDGGNNISEDKYSMMDVNNDGLVDLCFMQNGTLKAYVNTGHGFSTSAYTLYSSTNQSISKTSTYNIGANLSATGGIPIPIPVFPMKVVFSMYGNTNYSVSSVKFQFRDMNGDNTVDIVEVDNGAISVKYGVPKKVNLLKKVINPTRSAYIVDYQMTYPDRANPNSKWVMSSLKVYDGFAGDGIDTTYFKYAYDSAYYHRMERESFGFKIVKTMQYDNFTPAQICYRITVEKYHNDYYLFKGLKKYEVSMAGNSDMYVETYYTWDRKEISTGKIIPADSAECFGPYYPAISQEDKYFYEGLSAFQIHTRKTYRHTRFGNVREYKNYGDVAYTTDDFTATIVYSYNIPSNLLAMVSQMDVYDISNNLMQRRTGAYNAYGRISTIGAFDGSSYANTDVSYDNYGNVLYIQFPQNTNGERLSYSYEYDLSVHTYPISVRDYWGNTSLTTYDYKLGLPLVVTDLTGNEMHYAYYDDGKLFTVTGPNEVLAGIPYTIKCEYWDEQPYGTSLWAKTVHYDTLNTNNEFVTVNFADGLGRSVQSKQKATINGFDSLVVSGNVYYDAYGRAWKASLPVTQALGNELTFHTFTPTVFSTTTFDVLDRPLVQTSFDNTTVSYAYNFGTDAFGKTCFKTRVTDPNGKITDKFTNGRGLNTSITAPLTTITKFVYDPLGTLVQSTDPDGYTTSYKYDMLGRLTSRIHPDAGTTSYTYDLSGNVLKTQTANLAGLSQYIQYIYTDARLSNIIYPQNPEMNVYYEYGAPNSGNQSSRLVRQQDASGVQTFEYGNMGELIKNIHTFVVPNGNNYTFETDWEYDSWNRMKSILYSDGEWVSYHYDNGGKLVSMDGVKDSQTYTYIEDVKYNKYGSRTRIDYGNNTYALYTYNPLNQRLTNLISYEQTGRIMQDLDYTYDAASNITSIWNQSDFVGNNIDLGGSFKFNYEYDDLYRLSTADGFVNTRNNGSLPFETSMTYSASGKITSKSMYAQTLISGSVNLKNYSSTYQYYSAQPHTVQYAGGNSYSWDLNGNLIQRGGESERNLCWDEENRLMSVHDNGEKQHTVSDYIYDAGGERVWKLAGDVTTMYVNGQGYVNSVDLYKTLYTNPYVVVTDQEYSKHYYIEGERVCTKIGGGFGSAPYYPIDNSLEFISGDYKEVGSGLYNMVTRSLECTSYDGSFTIKETLDPVHKMENSFEDLQYFYHPDHLGSSSFITDATGYAVQHLQYLPFGETFVDQQNGYDSRYTFSAKEKDDETSYSYFGARYYDSDLSVWLSVDPLSDKYPNLSPYAYCANNPVLFKDPNGQEIIISYLDKNNEMQTYVYGSGNKVPRSKYLHKTIRTLNKIQRNGRDVMGVVGYFANSTDYDFNIVESHEVGSAVMDVTGTMKKDYQFKWNQNIGAKNKDGEEKYSLSPALLLLHEIGEIYYAINNPEGKLDDLRAWQKCSPDDYASYDEYQKVSTDWLNGILNKESEEVGKYGTYSDKWLIQNVEPSFQKNSRGRKRDTHSGVYMHIKGGTFSVRENKNKQE